MLLIFCGKCSEERFNLILDAVSRHRFARQEYVQRRFDDWRATTVGFMRNFLVYTVHWFAGRRRRRDVRETTKYIETALVIDRAMFERRNGSTRAEVVHDAIQVANIADLTRLALQCALFITRALRPPALLKSSTSTSGSRASLTYPMTWAAILGICLSGPRHRRDAQHTVIKLHPKISELTKGFSRRAVRSSLSYAAERMASVFCENTYLNFISDFKRTALARTQYSYATKYFRTLNTRVSLVYIESWQSADQADIDRAQDITRAILKFNDYTARKLFKIEKDTTQLLTYVRPTPAARHTLRY
ncbi:hypothetical protein EVAR_82291_1 [Eumeta japonica]|uniref:Peptidase M12B domain-containing protein n=1 Tax=Eumeta variegata TaxID=151549 RepID=A0A4C1W028_EUMVA|nr:hypothetical protein EVAR_82291_1 [Eumeta japonica]